MKILFFLFLLPALSFASTPKPYIISGFDDVLRQAENTGIIKASLKIFEKDQTFTGMPELYEILSRDNNSPKFAVVSAISHWFEGRIEEFLERSQYPSHYLLLRNWLTEWSIEDFKVNRIKQIIDSNPQRSFIVIFDNSDPSITLVKKIMTTFPGKIQAIYLRQVIKKDIPSEATPFYTSFDIALNEYQSDRLSMEELNSVASIILKEKNRENIIPNYASCPDSTSTCPELLDICQKVHVHIQKLCRR